MIPQKAPSKHLKSRAEVEEVFQSSSVPTTVLRAGLVVGKGGSSFEILQNLVKNLPAMVLPLWTKNKTQAIYSADLVREHIPENRPLREKFHIVGGVLARSHTTGWLEFRQTAGGRYTLAAIYEFVPALPWLVYRITQAPLHKHTMKAFGKSLRS